MNDKTTLLEIPPDEIVRTGQFADQPGALSVVALPSSQLLNPGDTFEITLMIAGYGAIAGGKLATYPSSNLFDLKACKVIQSIPAKGNKTSSKESTLDEKGFTAIFTQTFFADMVRGHIPRLLTEVWLPTEDGIGRPALMLILKLKPDASPGPHTLDFALTYYNGQMWQVSRDEAAFNIRTRYQRWEVPIWAIGITIAVISILATLFQPDVHALSCKLPWSVPMSCTTAEK